MWRFSLTGITFHHAANSIFCSLGSVKGPWWLYSDHYAFSADNRPAPILALISSTGRSSYHSWLIADPDPGGPLALATPHLNGWRVPGGPTSCTAEPCSAFPPWSMERSLPSLLSEDVVAGVIPSSPLPVFMGVSVTGCHGGQKVSTDEGSSNGTIDVGSQSVPEAKSK